MFQFWIAEPIPRGANSNNPTKKMNGITCAKPLAVGRSRAVPAPIKIGSETERKRPTISAPTITPGMEPIVPRTITANAGKSRERPSSGLTGSIAASRAPPTPAMPEEMKAVVA